MVMGSVHAFKTYKYAKRGIARSSCTRHSDILAREATSALRRYVKAREAVYQVAKDKRIKLARDNTSFRKAGHVPYSQQGDLEMCVRVHNHRLYKCAFVHCIPHVAQRERRLSLHHLIQPFHPNIFTCIQACSSYIQATSQILSQPYISGTPMRHSASVSCCGTTRASLTRSIHGDWIACPHARTIGRTDKRTHACTRARARAHIHTLDG